ncbi:MAG: nucleotidyltransferase family protein [Oscillospiraceae bacterium]|nr:nucleotidyltransferase family protein [Oscillospiraceae bacterium]
MKIAGIIAEYNPFHNGHSYHVRETKGCGADAVVAVMSSHFVQRGEPSVMSKWARAKMAVQSGVDLALELPVIWSCASAQRFAQGGVSILNALGCVDFLSFGSESGDISLLREAAKAACDARTQALIRARLSDGLSFAKTRKNAVRELFGDMAADVLRSPNDTLAVEYLSALEEFSSPIKPIVVKRSGVDHDSPDVRGDFASASLIRGLMFEGADFSHLVTQSAADVIREEIIESRAPVGYTKLETAMLMMLRNADPAALARLPDVSEGLENRVIGAAREALSLSELFSLAKTKRYAHARIRRAAAHALLGITADMQGQLPPYVRVLALNETGREILKKAKKTTAIPIIMKANELKNSGGFARTVFETERRAADVYALAMPRTHPGGTEFTEEVYVHGA